MKRTLAKQTVQDWSLLGLKPMHRALLRRCVELHNSTQNGTMPSERSVAWYVESWDSTCEKSILHILNRPGILLLDCNGLIERAQVKKALDPFLFALYRRSNPQIRLIWNWTLQGKQDLRWCTEMSFDGVIHDARSLMMWLPVCLRQGKSSTSQLNSFLRGVELPHLGKPRIIPN